MPNDLSRNKRYFVDDVIALCHIIDNFDEFYDNLLRFVQSKDNRFDILTLSKIVRGEEILGVRKIKRFYYENKETIDTINKYGNIYLFIINNFDSVGHLRDDSFITAFYEYFMMHKNEIDKILLVLNKINSLDFKSLYFDEHYDFTGVYHEMSTDFNDERNIVYVDNIELLPSSEKDIVKYKTNDSNYQIIIKRNPFICVYRKEIALNSLLFNQSRLPNTLSEKVIFDEILNLKEREKSLKRILTKDSN